MRSFPMLCTFAACLAMAPAHAQTLYGSLTGNVTDKTSSPIPNARVDALNVATGIAKQSRTDDRGSYLFNDLQPGSYKVSIAAPSFSTRVQDNVPIDANT